MVENAFAFLKTTFKELWNKSDLDVLFMPDVVTAYAILYNILLKQSHEEVEQLVHILYSDGFRREEDLDKAEIRDQELTLVDQLPIDVATAKCADLGGYLAVQRAVLM